MNRYVEEDKDEFDEDDDDSDDEEEDEFYKFIILNSANPWYFSSFS